MESDSSKKNTPRVPEGGNGRRVRTFTGEGLREVAFPLGGLGTGTVSLGGRGNLTDWEIFGRPGKGTVLPYSFFTLWAKSQGRSPFVRIVEREILPPFTGAHGLPWWQAGGMPRFPEAVFRGEFPLARVEFQDRECPLEICLEAFSPFIPMDPESTELPAAIFRFHLTNPGSRPVSFSFAGSLFNIIGYDGCGAIADPKFPVFRRFHVPFLGNVNRIRRMPGLTGLNLTSEALARDDPKSGSLCLACLDGGTPSDPETGSTAVPRWSRDRLLFYRLWGFWRDFSDDGRLETTAEEVCPEGESDFGTVGRYGTLQAGKTTDVTFILTWHFPLRKNIWEGGLPEDHPSYGIHLKNHYALGFTDAWDVACGVSSRLPKLEKGTKDFHAALFSSTLPPPVLDAASSGLSVLTTNSCFVTEDGVFHGFEGSGPDRGSCPLDCSHVWNYDQALGRLFPSLARSMRKTEFLNNTLDSGFMSHRTILPAGSGPCGRPAAADGQMGSLLKLYREWLVSGDRLFLSELWPSAKSALEYAWNIWDRDRDGVMEGADQLNTYDCQWEGPNPLTGVLYLAALEAASRMAGEMGDGEKEKEYSELRRLGAEKLDALLWNGSYYVQHGQNEQEGGDLMSKQMGRVCLSDQLIGQWFAHILGLGYLLPQGRVRKALTAIFRHNFRPELREHVNPFRVYGLQDEAGLLNGSFPEQPASPEHEPSLPHGFFGEVWTGVEYQVAAHLIYEGLVDEALRLVEAVRRRYDGWRRNPWNEIECGDHYVRSLSSWSLLLALSGVRYSAPEASLSFQPCLPENPFRCFWSAGSAWGLYEQQQRGQDRDAALTVLYGGITLREFGLGGAAAESDAGTITARRNGKPVKGHSAAVGGKVRFPEGLVLSEGETLEIRIGQRSDKKGNG